MVKKHPAFLVDTVLSAFAGEFPLEKFKLKPSSATSARTGDAMPPPPPRVFDHHQSRTTGNLEAGKSNPENDSSFTSPMVIDSLNPARPSAPTTVTPDQPIAQPKKKGSQSTAPITTAADQIAPMQSARQEPASHPPSTSVSDGSSSGVLSGFSSGASSADESATKRPPTRVRATRHRQLDE